MSYSHLPKSRRWSTWTAGRPAEFVHLPSGVTVTPLAYAASVRRATLFPPGPGVVLGPHAIDSSLVKLTLAHAGTALDWAYHKLDAETVVGEWAATSFGEWGLRFWISLCVSAPAGEVWRFDEEAGILEATIAGECFAIAFERAPLLVTGHQDLSGLKEEFERHGYWYLDSRATQGSCVALRFNLEEMPSNRFSIANGPTLADATRRALAALIAAPPATKPVHVDFAAARDIVAWNTVWDPLNRRPYTCCSRNWDVEKFGGFGVWLTDTAVSALIHSLFGEDQALENLEVLLAGQTQEGNFPCLLTGHDSWIDRSQPPIITLIVWLVYLQTGSRTLVEKLYEPLLRNHHWWWRTRDGNGNRILEYGSSSVGAGLYIGTKLAAKDESFMDNSPVHDEAHWVEQSRTLDCEDVGLNSLLALDAEMLGRLATVLGRHGEAKDHEARTEAHRNTVARHFWDDSRGIFANRLWDGRFVHALAPTSFFPLLIEAADAKQIASLLRHLSSRNGFGGKFILPSVARSDPAFKNNVYWRGRIWPILNWLVWLGLKRNGLIKAADDLARKSATLFSLSWKKRLAPENFNALTGQGLDQPDTDPFYSWTALLPLMSLADVMDIDPWQGWCLKNRRADTTLGPVASPAGFVHIARRKGWLKVDCNGKTLFATDLPYLSDLQVTPNGLTLKLPAGLARQYSLTTHAPIASVFQNGKSLKRSGRTEIRLERTGPGAELLELKFAP